MGGCFWRCHRWFCDGGQWLVAAMGCWVGEGVSGRWGWACVGKVGYGVGLCGGLGVGLVWVGRCAMGWCGVPCEGEQIPCIVLPLQFVPRVDVIFSPFLDELLNQIVFGPLFGQDVRNLLHFLPHHRELVLLVAFSKVSEMLRIKCESALLAWLGAGIG